VKRLKLRGLLRNACIVAGNSGRTALLPELRVLCRHGEPVVRAHAVWAVARLGGLDAEFAAELLGNETDPRVVEEITEGTVSGGPAGADG
jgi:epoxyqueuosine reductase